MGHGKHTRFAFENAGSPSAHGTGFRFSRLFPNLPPFLLKLSVSKKIGAAMTNPLVQRSDSDIPAGYTYFGQFVDHDITRDGTPNTLTKNTHTINSLHSFDGIDLIQLRSPSLDLDSVYGKPTQNGASSPRSDGVRFDFSLTDPVAKGLGNANKAMAYDLKRRTNSEPNSKPKSIALIPDNRNDENLAVAQIHALWMRFHNKIVDALQAEDPRLTGSALFESAKHLTIRHYQYIVLHDFVKRISDASVFDNIVHKNGSQYFRPTIAEIPAMPLEFSVGAYRFGHSLVREKYDWNSIFSKDGPEQPATFENVKKPSAIFSLFTFTSGGGFLGQDAPLPSSWIPDWRRFFDFTGTGVKVDQIGPQMTKKIDPYLSSGMRNIPGELNDLAALNLRRSGLRGLPDGQSVARTLGVPPLTKQQMQSGLDGALKKQVMACEFDRKAPLWFYILQEASVLQQGNRLGPVGSQIICETFIGLIKVSEPSILKQSWTPELSPLRIRNKIIDSLPLLLAFIDDKEPIINPLEDKRL